MDYQSDILIGLQNFREGKTNYLINLIKENYYDLCIKVNGGIEKSLIKYENEYIHLKEIPYSILFDIDTFISDECIINYNNLKEDINTLKVLNISLKKLFFSNNATIVTKTCFDKNLYMNASVDKIKKKSLKIKNLNSSEYYIFLLNNNIKRVNTYDFLKNYKKPIVYQHLSFNNDINYGTNFDSLYHCGSSFCTNIVNFRTISNIYGVSCVYDIYKNNLCDNKELEPLKYFEGLDYNLDWLNLDKLLINININNVNVLIFTKSKHLSKLNIYKIYYKNELNSFSIIESFKKFLRDIIYLECNISYIKFVNNF